MRSITQYAQRWFPQTVTLEPVSGVNGYGERTYGSAVSYPARIVAGNFQVVDGLGQEKVARHKIWLQTNSLIDPESRVTLPSGYTPQQPPIVDTKTYPDETGNHHTVLMTG